MKKINPPRQKSTRSVLVMSCDSVTNYNVKDIWEWHTCHGAALTVVVAPCDPKLLTTPVPGGKLVDNYGE